MKQLKIAFVVGIFPAPSETFIIDQICDLIDRGIDVQVFSFWKGPVENSSARYRAYRLVERTHYLTMPKNKPARIIAAIPKLISGILLNPRAIGKMLSIRRYGADARSLKLLFWCLPFLYSDADLYHCHFGPVANDFMTIRDITDLGNKKMIVSFYGYDASKIFNKYSEDPYYRLKHEVSKILVMSEDMKQRLMAHGFQKEKIIVHPVGVRPEEYPFSERHRENGERAEIISVGRFVEKKGFDDLLRALAIVKERLGDVFRCTIVGDGPLHDKIYQLAEELKLKDVFEFKGMMPIQNIISLFAKMHFFVQPSKTAADGDME